MDPFLESPCEWPSFHSRFLAWLDEILAASVPPGYRVDLEKRVYLEAYDPVLGVEERQSVPDVAIIEYRQRQNSGARLAEGMQAEYAPAMVYANEATVVEETYIEIRDVTRRNEVVTIIELISRRNKTANTRGKAEFDAKRQLVMRSRTHWIELDFLRAGERQDMLAGKSDYYTLLKRAGQPKAHEVCFFGVRDPMPVIAVPLRAEHADVLVDLQAVMNTCYARAHYANFLPYADEAAFPLLRPADARWAREQLALLAVEANVSAVEVGSPRR